MPQFNNIKKVALILVVAATNILLLYLLNIVKEDQKGCSEGSWKSLLCILLYYKTRHRRGGESKVSLNPNAQPWLTPFNGNSQDKVLIPCLLVEENTKEGLPRPLALSL